MSKLFGCKIKKIYQVNREPPFLEVGLKYRMICK